MGEQLREIPIWLTILELLDTPTKIQLIFTDPVLYRLYKEPMSIPVRNMEVERCGQARDIRGLWWHSAKSSEFKILRRLLDMDKNTDNFNLALYNTFLYNQYEAAQMLLSNLPNPYDYSYINHCLEAACKGGNMDLVKLALSHGANYYAWGFYGGCLSGNIEIVELMIQHGANKFDQGLGIAARKNNVALGKYLISKGATNFNLGLSEARHRNNEEFKQFILTRMAVACPARSVRC